MALFCFLTRFRWQVAFPQHDEECVILITDFFAFLFLLGHLQQLLKVQISYENEKNKKNLFRLKNLSQDLKVVSEISGIFSLFKNLGIFLHIP